MERKNEPSDRTNFLSRMPQPGCILYGPKGCGKSTMLSMLAYYFDENLSSEKLFQNTNFFNKHPEQLSGLNESPVIYLSFSDIKADRYSDAIFYIGEKMAVIYQKFMYRFLKNEHLYWQDMDYYLDILLGKADEREIQCSLYNLLKNFDLENDEKRHKSPVVLIDDFTQLYETAYANGYGDRMDDFCKFWLVNPLDHFTNYFLITGEGSKFNYFYQENVYPHCVDDSRFRDYFFLNPDKDGFLLPMRKRYQKPILEKEDLAIIFDRKKWVVEEEYRQKLEQLRSYKRHVEDYKTPFPSNLVIGTAYAGLRILPKMPRNTVYYKLNSILNNMFLSYGVNKDSEQIYSALQNINEERITDWMSDHRKNEEQLEGIIEKYGERWNCCKTNPSTYWQQISAIADDVHYPDACYIKVYLSPENCRLGEIFLYLVEQLLESAQHTFWAKVAKREREDAICVWIRCGDLHILDACVKAWESQLTIPLSFIAYRNKMGISRELIGCGSYHRTLTELFCDYFAYAADTGENIDLYSAYQFFINCWNDVESQMLKNNRYVYMNAQAFIVILETLNCIIFEEEVTDNHFLLNVDKKIWKALEQSCCWKELGDILASDREEIM